MAKIRPQQNTLFSLSSAIFLLLQSSLAGIPPPQVRQCQTIEALLCTLGGFDITCKLLQDHFDWQYNVNPTLSTNWTAFVPTDRAFEALQAKHPALLEKNETITDLLAFHLAEGITRSPDLICTSKILMSNGQHSRTVCLPQSTELYQKGGDNGADGTSSPQDWPQIIITDVEACNGVIHILSGVMLPEGILEDVEGRTEPPVDVAMTDPPVTRAPMAAQEETKEPTFPTEAPQTTETLTVAPETAPPKTTLSPTPLPTTQFFERPTQPPTDCLDIVDFVCGSRVLSSFCNLLRDYNLVDDLAEAASITLFVPYNPAFDSVDLSELSFDAVRDVLIFHAAPSIVTTDQLQCRALLEMANGKDTRTYCEGGLFQKGAGNVELPKILVRDTPVCNGMVHIVDRVLLPYEI